MARNGSGTFALLATVAPANTVSSSTTVNSVMDDIATGLTDSINKDGTKAFEANQSVGGFKFTSLGDGSARTDSHNIGQAQDGKLNWVAAGGTADAITATYSPAITALVDGQICFVRASGANTVTAPTFAPNGLTARTIYKNGGTALAVGDISGAGHELILRYLTASTRWELLNPASTAAASPASTTEQLTGTSTAVRSTPDSVAALWEAGADIADGAAITIGEGGYFNLITSTTAITSFIITTNKAGRTFRVRFDTARTLTHNATSLIIPGGANITTAQGDIAQIRSLGSGNVVVDWYTKASGLPVIAPTVTTITLVAEQASTSGTAITFGSIPAGVKRITVMFDGVSFSGGAANTLLCQLGDAGGLEATGYNAAASRVTDAVATTLVSSSTGFNLILTAASSASNADGQLILNRQDSSHTWVASWTLVNINTSPLSVQTGAGTKQLSAELTQLAISGGTFDAGSISISYES